MVVISRLAATSACIVIGKMGAVVPVRGPWTIVPVFTTVAVITITRSLTTIVLVVILDHCRSTTIAVTNVFVIALVVTLDGGFLLLLLLLSPHVTIEDAHEVRAEVSDGGSIHRGHFFNGTQGVLFGKHPDLRLDLVVLCQIIRGTKSVMNEFLETLVDRGCHLFSHRQGIAVGPGPRGAFLDGDVPLNDAKEVGPVVAN